MADDPPDVRGRPEDFSRPGIVDRLHAVAQRDGVATVVPDHPLGLTGRPGSVEDVEGVGGRDGHAFGGAGPRHRLGPVEGAPAPRWPGLLPLAQNAAGPRLTGPVYTRVH